MTLIKTKQNYEEKKAQKGKQTKKIVGLTKHKGKKIIFHFLKEEAKKKLLLKCGFLYNICYTVFLYLIKLCTNF